MNPKTPQDLDPKLKEAYDRVMGGNFAPSTPPVLNPIPKIETAPPAAPITSPPPSIPLNNPMPVNMQPLSAMSPTTTASPEEQVISTKKKSKLSPKLFLIVGIVFFIIYALVWGKLFKLF